MANRLQVHEGQRFGKLVVVREIDPKEYYHPSQGIILERWTECVCDCGNIHQTRLYPLLKNKVLSCGCLIKEIRHSEKKLICGFGINDYNGYIRENGVTMNSYQVWVGMIKRCYGEKKVYLDCLICDEWRYFSSFKKWFDKNVPYFFDVCKYQLDKDLLIRGNKIYKPSSCSFVPQEINKVIINCKKSRGEYPVGVCYNKRVRSFGASCRCNGKQNHLGYFDNPRDAFDEYKRFKENHIKEVATEYYSDGKISKKVHDALMKWEVSIQD